MFDEGVTDDVLVVKLDDPDTFDRSETLNRVSETGVLGRREVNLRQVARDNHLASYTQTGEEHLELRHGRVLRLVQNNNGVTQRATAHKS